MPAANKSKVTAVAVGPAKVMAAAMTMPDEHEIA